MDCEICGRKDGAMFYVSIEGARMSACGNCSRGAQIIGRIGSVIDEKTKVSTPTIEFKEKETEIVDNYGKMIKDARMRRMLELKDLAKQINENEAYLKHIENEKIMPTIKTAKKLEKELGIRLVNESTVIVSETNTITKKENFSLQDTMEKDDE
jgi:putative transcription factor